MRKDPKLSRTRLRDASAVLAAAGIAAAVSAGALAQDVPAPNLAPNVKAHAAYEAAPAALYVGNPTPVHTDITPYAPRVAELEVGEKVAPLAKVKGWNWYVVGKDGVGIGYVTGDMLSKNPIPKR